MIKYKRDSFAVLELRQIVRCLVAVIGLAMALIPQRSVAQENERAVNAVSIELGRTGLITNISYERLVIRKAFGVRIFAGKNFARYLQLTQAGVGVFALASEGDLSAEGGFEVNYISADNISSDQNRGLALVYPNYTVEQFCPAFLLGARRYRKETLLRVGFAATFISSRFVPGGYLSLGKVF